MGRIVVVAYRPKKDGAEKLRNLVRGHHANLQAEGLVTDRTPVIMESTSGDIVEVFEWASADAIEKAHTNAAVQAMWEEFATVCDYIPAADVREFSSLFSEFRPLLGITE